MILMQKMVFALVVFNYKAFRNTIDCSTLNSECTRCSNSNLCTACSNGKLAHQSFCVVTCPPGYYKNGGICTGKITQILFMYLIACTHLDLDCNLCTNSSYCSTCFSNKFAYESVCLSSCPSTTYIDNVRCTG